MVKRRVLKICSECEDKEAATSKSCQNKTCRYFTKQTGSSFKRSASKDDLSTTRTKRERKQNPKFIDSEKSEEISTENKNAKKRVKRPKSVVSTEITPRRSQRNTEEARAARAKRTNRKIPIYGGEDLCAKLSKEKQELAALFLAEINRKLSSVVWKI